VQDAHRDHDATRPGHSADNPGVPPSARPDATVVIEESRRLSESLIWALQRTFYARAGLQAWKPKAVPFYITSNSFTARAYARTVAGFLRDLVAAGRVDRAAPIYLVELAAGSGQFAYLFLRRLAELQDQVPALAGLDLRYVMTDFAQSNVDAWERHERLAPLREQGRLDSALFDLERDHELRLRRAGVALAAGSVANPVVVLANYAFDSTTQDAFQVKDGVLYERLARVLSTRPERDLSDPDLLRRIQVRYELSPVAEGRYEDPRLTALLGLYVREHPQASFLLPVGAFRCVRTFEGISGGRLLLLTGDKAVTRAEEMAHAADPTFYIHAGGCFSFLANLHALGRDFEEAGGTALVVDRRDQRLKVAALLTAFPGVAWNETRLAFRQSQEDFGPADYHSLVFGLREQNATLSLQAILAQIRLGGWDYELVFSWREQIIKLAPQAPPWQQADLADALERVWDEYYPIQRDLAFELARIFVVLKRAEQAMRFGLESLRTHGPHYLTHLSIGYSCVLLGREAEAMSWIERSLELNPDNAAATSLLDGLRARRGG
jgi:tetratricopeptide (TPR) repeat protein